MPDAAPPSPVTTSHWTSNVRQQVVAQLASGSLPAAGTEGRSFAVTDRDRYEYDNGSAIIPGVPWSSSGRVGWSLTRAGTQSISSGTGTFTAISWTAETTDTDSFIAVTGDTVTIPTNLGGLYAGVATVTWASSPGTNSTIELLVGATAYRFPVGAATQSLVSSISIGAIALAATNTVQIRVSQGSGGAINVTAVWQMWRLSA